MLNRLFVDLLRCKQHLERLNTFHSYGSPAVIILHVSSNGLHVGLEFQGQCNSIEGPTSLFVDGIYREREYSDQPSSLQNPDQIIYKIGRAHV